jgi:hypothetical protein
MKLLAKNFSNRQDIEKHVANKFGLTPDPKDHTIEGTREELARLGLSDRTVFWGIPCKITDDATPAKSNLRKPERGPKHEGGINGSKKRKNG